MKLFKLEDIKLNGLEIFDKYKHTTKYQDRFFVVKVDKDQKIPFDEKQMLFSLGWKNYDTTWTIDLEVLYYMENE